MDNALEYLKKFLEKFVHNLKELSVASKHFPLKDYSEIVCRLRNLISLTVEKNEQKIDLLKHGFVNIHQILKITDVLHLQSTNITINELVLMKCKKLYICLMSLTENDVIEYIRMWKNGEILKKDYIWLWISTPSIHFDRLKNVDGSNHKINPRIASGNGYRRRKDEIEFTMRNEKEN